MKICKCNFGTFLARFSVFLQSVVASLRSTNTSWLWYSKEGSCASSLLPLLASSLEKVSLESCSPQKCERSRRSRILFPTNLRSESSVTHHQFCKQSPSIYLYTLAKNSTEHPWIIFLVDQYINKTKNTTLYSCIFEKDISNSFHFIDYQWGWNSSNRNGNIKRLRKEIRK